MQNSVRYDLLARPPRLHWGWVLALSIVTLSLFGIVWLLVQAIWARRVRNTGWSVIPAVLYVLHLPCLLMVAVILALLEASDSTMKLFEVLIRLSGLVLYCTTVFMLRAELESPEIGLSLSGVMTFFFGPLFFQYHLRDYSPHTEEGTMFSSFTS